MARSPADIDYSGYLEWAQNNLGVILHYPLRVSSTAGKEERGVFCEEDISADTIVVSVPWEVRLQTLCTVFGATQNF